MNLSTRDTEADSEGRRYARLEARAFAGYRARYGREPTWVADAPGRVNLIGEHTDYNDGLVFPMAIDRRTIVVAGPATNSERISIASGGASEAVNVDLTRPVLPDRPQWGNYCRGVVAGFQRLGILVPPMDAWVESDIPMGGGLSSSAALEVAFATLLETAGGRSLGPTEKALLCLRAEHEFAGLPCGLMDQFAVTLGREGQCLLIDCRSQSVEFVPFTEPSLAVLILNTNVRHELGASEYPIRRAQCQAAAHALGMASLRDADLAVLGAGRDRMDAAAFRRARHVLTENERTIKAAAAMKSRDWETLGRLMYASHESLRNDFEVSCPELDAAVEIAAELGLAGGVFGCRMTGGGFGGCTVSLVEAAGAAPLSAALAARFEGRTGRAASLFLCRAAAGARQRRCEPHATGPLR